MRLDTRMKVNRIGIVDDPEERKDREPMRWVLLSLVARLGTTDCD